MPGTANWAFDESTFLWNMWWVKYSLLNLGQSPLHTSYIFYPLGIDLVTYTVNFYNALVGLPLTLNLPLPLASNLMLLFSYVTSAFGGYLLARYVLRPARATTQGRPYTASRRGDPMWSPQVGAAFIAGAVYAFAASRMMYAALGHYNFVTVQAFPFFALFLLKTLREPGWRNPILAGIFAALNLMAEMTFGVMMLFLGGLIVLLEGLRAARAPGAETEHAPRAVGADPATGGRRGHGGGPVRAMAGAGAPGVRAGGLRTARLGRGPQAVRGPGRLVHAAGAASAVWDERLAGAPAGGRRGEGSVPGRQHGVPGIRRPGPGGNRRADGVARATAWGPNPAAPLAGGRRSGLRC